MISSRFFAAGSPSKAALDVFSQHLPQFRNRFKEPDRDQLGVTLEIGFEVAGLAIVPEGAGDLLGEAVVQAVDEVADMVADVPHVQVLAAAVAGIKDFAEVARISTISR